MNKTEILNIVNEPSKHIQIVNLDGKDSIVYSAKFVELLELIPTMLTKADMISILDEIKAEIDKHKSTIEKAISEDELKIEGLKEAYTDCFEIIDNYRKG